MEAYKTPENWNAVVKTNNYFIMNIMVLHRRENQNL